MKGLCSNTFTIHCTWRSEIHIAPTWSSQLILAIKPILHLGWNFLLGNLLGKEIINATDGILAMSIKVKMLIKRSIVCSFL